MKAIKPIFLLMGAIVLLLFMPEMVLAQGAPPATPIDGGLSLLLAGGAAYGIKKIRDHRKEIRR